MPADRLRDFCRRCRRHAWPGIQVRFRQETGFAASSSELLYLKRRRHSASQRRRPWQSLGSCLRLHLLPTEARSPRRSCSPQTTSPSRLPPLRRPCDGLHPSRVRVPHDDWRASSVWPSTLLRLMPPPQPSTDGSIVPSPAYSPTPVSRLTLVPPRLGFAGQSTHTSPPLSLALSEVKEVRSKSKPRSGLARAWPRLVPTSGLASAISCSVMTGSSIGLSGWSCVPKLRSKGWGAKGEGEGTTTSSSVTPSASASESVGS